MMLRDYQEDAADFLYEHDRAMVLAPVGAGKTAITLTAMRDALTSGVVRRFLVLAPKRVALHVWPAERLKWASRVSMALAVGTPRQRGLALHSDAQIVVTNYDNLHWLTNQVLDFDGLVCDELTKLKNPGGKRFKTLLAQIERFRVRWGLTGSFTSNGLEDVFGQCKVIDQRLLGRSKGAFLQEYFVCVNRDFGEWEPRVGSLAKVMARIKPATYLLEPGEYADTLPPLRIVPMRCDMPDYEPYARMKRDFIVRMPTAEIVAANSGAVTAKLQQMACGFVYDTQVYASDTPGQFDSTKTPIWFSDHKLDLLDDVLEENQRANTVVFYWYKAELAALKAKYPRAVTLDDEGAVERWNAGKVELLLAQPSSAGHGLNLQFGGSRIVFLSLPWSLELYEQAIGRLHRSGQKHDVWVYVLLTNKTIDEQMFGALADKRALSDIAMEALR